MSGPYWNSVTRKDAAEQAARWVTRIDRGLTDAEQQEFDRWLGEDPRNSELLARHEVALERMMELSKWQPGDSNEVNPDLFAPTHAKSGRRPTRSRIITVTFAALAGAAAAVLVWAPWTKPSAPASTDNAVLARESSYLRVSERRALPDGSLVELKDGTQLTLRFTPGERRVHLSSGEAHFAVAKNPNRPFIVEAGGVSVRAVGTAFDVRYDPRLVDVFVTEGKVRVDSRPVEQASGADAEPNAALIVAGQQATVTMQDDRPTAATVVHRLSAAEMADALAWRVPRLQFHETPLVTVVAEFNRNAGARLVIGDHSLDDVPIGGTFRLDNVDGFVRLLDVSLGVRGEKNPNGEIVLRRSP